MGFLFDKKPAALDRAFLNSLEPENRDDVQNLWTRMHSGFAHISELYSVPETEKQAALLFSHDAKRLITSMTWFEDVVNQCQAKSILEAGCGAGYLLRFLHYIHPHLKVRGIDKQKNLIAIAEEAKEIEFRAEAYSEVDFEAVTDLVICDFGWDNQDIPKTRTPHSIDTIAGTKFCPGCSDDQIPFFFDLLSNFSRWVAPEGHVAVVGRLPDVGAIRAFLLAAKQCNLTISPDNFRILATTSNGEREKFPAFVFSKSGQNTEVDDIEKIIAKYVST